MARFVSGPRVTRGHLPGARTRGLDDDVGAMPLRDRSTRRGQLRVADPARPVGLGRRLQGADQRHLAPERHLDVVASGELEHGQGVLDDLLRLDVARAARHGQQVGLR